MMVDISYVTYVKQLLQHLIFGQKLAELVARKQRRYKMRQSRGKQEPINEKME